MTPLIELHYLPSIAYFSAICVTKHLCIEKHEHFVKQSYRNRCQIVGADGRKDLIIPVRHSSGKVPVGEVRIDHTQKWINNHWRTIRSAYGKAPFFEHYADDLHNVMYRKQPFLYDLNRQLLSMCLTALRLDITISETPAYSRTSGNDLLDLRDAINVKNKEGLDGIFTPVPYRQVFGSSFAVNASIIDLIFCVGPEQGGGRGAVRLEPDRLRWNRLAIPPMP